jgi:hypothetical protein
MAISLKHKMVSAKADGGDNSLVQPGDWNDEHDLLMGTAKILGRFSGGTGVVEEITWAVLDDPIVIACSDETTAITASSTTAKVTFRMPYPYTLEAVRASLTVAQTSGSTFTVDIKEAGTSILSTLLTIDNGEKSSVDAAVGPAISDTALADNAEITIFVTQVGDGTAKGLKVALIGKRTW